MQEMVDGGHADYLFYEIVKYIFEKRDNSHCRSIKNYKSVKYSDTFRAVP